MKDEIIAKAEKYQLPWVKLDVQKTQEEYIEEVVRTCASSVLYPDHDKGCVIVDGDTIFWENCEFWNDGISAVLSGYYIPEHHNIWTDTWCVSRLHPSFLIIEDCSTLMRLIKSNYPQAYQPLGWTCGFRPFHPVTVFEGGDGLFYDIMANVYHMIGGNAFTDKQKDAYSHINSASCYDEVMKRLSDDDRLKFNRMHEWADKNPELLRGNWKHVDAFYRRQGAMPF